MKNSNYQKNKEYQSNKKQRSLHRPQTEGVICGKNPVLEALRSDRTLNKVLAAAGQEPGFLRQVRELCREKHVPFLQVERSALAMYPDNRGVVALAAPFAYAEVEDILAAAEAKGEAPLVIVLAGVEDPHNLGAVLRTAEGVGAHGVMGSEGRGLPPLVAKKCDFMVKIPMCGRINSFNVSVSCAMVLGEVLRQRQS